MKEEITTENEYKQLEQIIETMDKEDITIEKGFEQLEQIIRTMDKEDIPLERAFKLYHDGMKLVELCNGKIEKIENDMLIVNGSEA